MKRTDMPHLPAHIDPASVTDYEDRPEMGLCFWRCKDGSTGSRSYGYRSEAAISDPAVQAAERRFSAVRGSFRRNYPSLYL